MKPRFVVIAVILACSASTGTAGWKDDVGYTSLQERLGTSIPTGAAIDVTQVEGIQDGGYLPDLNDTQFGGKTITPMSGSSGTSDHATIVGHYYYGLTVSMARDVDIIDVYEAVDWTGNGFLRNYTSSIPETETRRIQNHSWVGTFSNNDTLDIDALRRLDYVIVRDGILAVVGVGNGSIDPMPKLLANTYNALAVGRSDAISSRAPTTLDEPGRLKPDIVAPFLRVSWVVPVVSSAGAVLLQTADAASNMDYMSRLDKALLVKTVLMAGATKEELNEWRKGFVTPSTDGTVPLDYRYGAGELNIDNSHLILTGGEQDAGTSSDVDIIGWDIGNSSSTENRQYFFEVPPYFYIDKLSILVTWNRTFTVSGGFPKIFTPSLADIDLRLYHAEGYSVGTLIDESISDIDNVEHIYLRQQMGGRYVFEIAADTSWDYAMAWNVQLAPSVKPDFTGDGDVDMEDFNYFQSCSTGPALGPPVPGCEMADLDNDSDIDQEDFGLFQLCISGIGNIPDPSCEL